MSQGPALRYLGAPIAASVRGRARSGVLQRQRRRIAAVLVAAAALAWAPWRAAAVAGDAPAVQAITVPASPADLQKPHLTYSGAAITLKGVARNGANQFQWDFGDGSATPWLTIGDPYNLGVAHSYTGNVGDIFTATLSVRDSAHPDVVATAAYPVEIEAGSDLTDPAQAKVRAAMALDAALWYLHLNATRSTYGTAAPGYGQPAGVWQVDGRASVPATCATINAFEEHGSLVGGDGDRDPYVEDVQRGMNTILAGAAVYNISQGERPQNPDVNGNGFGISLGKNETYNDGICALAVARSGFLGRVAATGPTGVVNRSYAEIGQDLADWIAWSQTFSCTSCFGHGGWGYGALTNSANGDTNPWPILALAALDSRAGATIPRFVRQDVPYFLTYIHNTVPTSSDFGGYGYHSPTDDLAVSETAGGILAHLFIGDNAAHPDVRSALTYIHRHWADADPAHSTNIGDSVPMLLTVEALKGAGLTQIANYVDNSAPFDPFYTQPGQAQTGYGNYLVSHQYMDGSILDTAVGYVSYDGGYPYGDNISATAFNALVLENLPLAVGDSLPADGPLANAGGPYSGPTNATVTLDASQSSGSPVSFAWDLNNDGIFGDATGSTAAFTIPDALVGTTYPVCVRIADGSGATSSACSSVRVVSTPLPPVCAIVAPAEAMSNTGGPMTFSVDGSPSSDPGGLLLTYAWSTQDGPAFDAPTSAVTTQRRNMAHAGAQVSWTDTLTVSDGLASASCTKTITVIDNLPPVFTITPQNVTFEADANTGARVSAWLANVAAVDAAAPDGAIVAITNDFTPNAGIGGVGAGNRVTVTWTATNPDDPAVAAQTQATVTVVDTVAPALSLPSNMTTDATSPGGAAVVFTASATDFASGNVPVTCTPASGSTFGLGTTTVNCSASDGAGNTATGSFSITVADATPPSVTCAHADGLWHGANVTLGCGASDTGSGLASSADAAFSLSTAVAAGIEIASAATGTHVVCDNAGHCVTAGPIAGNMIDRRAPAISCSAASFTLNQSLANVTAVAVDLGSGPAMQSLVAAADTSTAGTRSVTFSASDSVGNVATQTCAYTVGYAFGGFLVPLSKSTPHKAGSTIPVKFVIGDATGNPIDAATAAALAASNNVEVTLAGPNMIPEVTLCGWNAAASVFQCNVKTPGGLHPGAAYTITAAVNTGGGFVALPAAGAAVNPAVIYFK